MMIVAVRRLQSSGPRKAMMSVIEILQQRSCLMEYSGNGRGVHS
jgi:hypothetical protein